MIRLFRVFVPTSVVALLVSETILLFASYILCTYWILTIDPQVFLLYDNGLIRIAINVTVIILALYYTDLYTDFRAPFGTLVQQLCLVMGVAFITQALISYANNQWILPRWIMVEGSVTALVALTGWRLLYSSTVLRFGSQRILFLGAAPLVVDIAKQLNAHPELGFVAIGYIAETEGVTEDLDCLKCLGTIADLKDVVTVVKPDRIVVGMNERRHRMPVYDLLDLRFAGIITEEAAHTYEFTFGRVCAREIRPSHLIFSTELGPRPNNVNVQTVYSWLIAFVAVVILLPIMALVALAVKLTSSGPILFRQERVGLRGSVYTVYKFRSMYKDAEARTGAVWAKRDDPRITPVGRVIRKIRLDELPQLFNVLQGTMSIVGPRPERPEFVQTLNEKIPYYRQRHSVKPGITGWAQIRYKYGESIEDTMMKLEYDLYYIKNLSPSLDFLIMFQTIKTMLFSQYGQ